MIDQNKICFIFCSRWGANSFKYELVVSSTLSVLGTKCLHYYVLGKEVMDVSYFSFFASLSDLPPLHKVEPLISNVLRVFHQKCFCIIKRFFFS